MRLDYLFVILLPVGHRRPVEAGRIALFDLASRLLLVPEVKAYRPGGAKASHRVLGVGNAGVGNVTETGSNTRRHISRIVSLNWGSPPYAFLSASVTGRRAPRSSSTSATHAAIPASRLCTSLAPIASPRPFRDAALPMRSETFGRSARSTASAERANSQESARCPLRRARSERSTRKNRSCELGDIVRTDLDTPLCIRIDSSGRVVRRAYLVMTGIEHLLARQQLPSQHKTNGRIRFWAR